MRLTAENERLRAALESIANEAHDSGSRRVAREALKRPADDGADHGN
jgi:hypothetical protein